MNNPASAALPERKCTYRCALLADLHRRPGSCDFAPEISQRECPLATGEWNPRRAGDLADILVMDADRRSRRWRPILCLESHERAMHVAAGVDALHNLLPNVAAFGKVQRVLLAGLLRQIAFPKVNSEARYASNNAVDFQRIASHGLGSGGLQPIPNFVGVLGGKPDLVPIQVRLRAARDRDAGAAPNHVAHLASFQLRHLIPRIGQHLASLRPDNADTANFVANVGDLDVVHDDVAIEDGGDGGRLLPVGRYQQVLATVVGNKVSLDASLRAEQKAVHAVARSKVTNVVGDHSVEPADAVFATQHQLGLPAHVKNRAAFEQHAKFSRGIAKRRRRLRSAIAAETSAGGRELLLGGRNTHTEPLIIAE